MKSSVYLLQYYGSPGLSVYWNDRLLKKLKSIDINVDSLDSEYCNYIECKEDLTSDQRKTLEWILSSSFTKNLSIKPFLSSNDENSVIIEIGPTLNFCTAFSSNSVSIANAVGLKQITRIEKSIRYLIKYKDKLNISKEKLLVQCLHDKMTQQRYLKPLETFNLNINPISWTYVKVLENGKEALKEISDQFGLSFDDWDLDYYTCLFRDRIKRNPTSVECFDLAQSNSEHSRHWFFRGKLIIDGKEYPKCLLDMIKDTQKFSNNNNIIKFSDNSSAIKGFKNLKLLLPKNSCEASIMKLSTTNTRHLVFTAETHNFPTGVAPFQGATTGTGGRIRDVHATGKGAHVIAGTAGYSFGNLLIPGYKCDWEDENEEYPENFALPVDICIEASNGASDYGNKFGEPLVAGFTRSFGMRMNNGERWEWIKPIMFSGGIGSLDDKYIAKNKPKKNMLVAKIGGPAYRIGVGGGSASSIKIQGDDKDVDLNLGAVQRGDPEMEQKLNRLIRACIENNENPIESIHDQGAGGNGNVLKEIVEPSGALINTKNFTLGDETLNTCEIWGAEYQESNAILIDEKNKFLLEKIGKREKCPYDFVGNITGDGKIILIEERENFGYGKSVDLDLELVLGSMPPKVFNLNSAKSILEENITIEQLIKDKSPIDWIQQTMKNIFKLVSVGSKRFLTNKVDRSVTGLIAQQQCVGPLQVPVSDYAVIALSYFDYCGGATSIGEQPIKGLINPSVGARLSIAEALTNLIFVKITSLQDVKCSGNWMWPAKLSGEGSKLVQACEALCNTMSILGIAIDGGKDSLSMAAKVGKEIVKSPGTIVISCYTPVDDIRIKVTPALKGGMLLRINLGSYYGSPQSKTSKSFYPRIGGTALAQVYSLISSPPDLDDPLALRNGFEMIQSFLASGLLLSGHDISDGGLITTVLEMAIAGNKGCTIKLDSILELFSEEIGIIIEVNNDHLEKIIKRCDERGLGSEIIGETSEDDQIRVWIKDTLVINAPMKLLMDYWESTSFQLELLQANPKCVTAEHDYLLSSNGLHYNLTFNPNEIKLASLIERDDHFTQRPRVAVIREEGINGDREMIASLFMAGFDVFDVMITDILNDDGITLDCFRGLVFPGGFSYADVLGSATGWAATLQFNKRVSQQLKHFNEKSDTFSLGVCNGCQLLALMGWVGAKENGTRGTLLATNESERFESRFVKVRINKDTNSIMLKEMEDSILGVWVAHHEGKFVFDDGVLNSLKNQCIALSYVDDNGNPTTKYPMNPNGSVLGIAGITSRDGRHLALMPHPERCTQLWQWPYVPEDWKSIKISPWCKMFTNAFEWCSQ